MSPSTMQEIAAHIERCAIATQQLILGEIARHGENKSDHPFATAFIGGEWWIYIDVNMPKATFDVETHAPDQHNALLQALSRVRRQFTIAA